MHSNSPLAVALCASPTVPENFEVHLPDVPPEFIPQFDRVFRQTICQLSRAIDLSQLDGVTIGLDYAVALASIDRGIPNLPPLASTATAELTGIAMAVDVVRDGTICTHLVFSAEPILAILFEGNGFTPEALIHAMSVVAHECAHVQIAAEKRRAIPDCGIDRPSSSEEQATLLGIAEPWWDEYAACRLSAPFAIDQAERSAAAVVACAAVARSHADAAVRKFLMGGNLDCFIEEAKQALFAPLTSAVYLAGAIDGTDSSWESHPGAWQALRGAGLAEIVGSLHAELRRLWDSYEDWAPTLETFVGLQRIAKEAFASHGIELETLSDGSCLYKVQASKRHLDELSEPRSVA